MNVTYSELARFDTFLARLDWVRQERNRTPWLKSLGFSSGDVSRIAEGHVVGPEKLSRLATCENLNLNWLLTGQGTPFVVEPLISNEHVDGQIQRWLEIEPLRIVIVSPMSETPSALIAMNQEMTTSSAFRIRCFPVSCTNAYRQKLAASSKVDLSVESTSNTTYKLIVGGMVGTYLLFYAKRPQLNVLGAQVREPVADSWYDLSAREKLLRLIDDLGDDQVKALVAMLSSFGKS